MLRGMFRAVLSLTAATAIVAAVAAPAVAAVGDRAYWDLNEPGSPATAVDSSGNGNNGTNYNITGTGEGYVFNGVSSRVIVPDSASLDPGSADFSYGATIVMNAPPETNDTDDIIRKGITSSAGGDYKLEIKNVNGSARARCLVKDAAKVVVAIQDTKNVADGLTHKINCAKTSIGVTITVDSRSRTKTVVKLGSVSNGNNLALGAKAEATAKTGFDWFTGTMLDAWVR